MWRTVSATLPPSETPLLASAPTGMYDETFSDVRQQLHPLDSWRGLVKLYAGRLRGNANPVDSRRPKPHSRLPLLLECTMNPLSMFDSSSERVGRGGGLSISMRFDRVADRLWGWPVAHSSNLGFRCARSTQ